MVASPQSELQDFDVDPNPKISISILAAGPTGEGDMVKIKDFGSN